MNDIPAFPYEHGPYIVQGMTLRDWYAGKAMQCFLSGSNLYEFSKQMADIIAAKSSIMARAMLKARERKDEGGM